MNPQRRIVRYPTPELDIDLGSLHPVLRSVLLHRGVRGAEDIDYSLRNLIGYEDMPGIAAAVDVLRTALYERRSLLVVGDYDADGATSCALAVSVLSAMGAAQVDYLVPNRQQHGYGLSPAIVELASVRDPDVIITVDNGIASIEGVAAARQRGIEVIVTDHHLPGAELPAASAVVNPNLTDSRFASPNLAGVGVIFYLLSALRAVLRDDQWFQRQGLAEPNLAVALDLIALGTVADVVPLDLNNRILVAQGLARIRAGHCRPGIRALAEIAGRRLDRLQSSDLAFALAPRLNAAGRLTDMSLGIECLLSETLQSARVLASRLDALNSERRQIEADMQVEALDAIEDLHLDGELPLGLCLCDANWHEGVVGILASRLKDRFQRPAIAFAPGADGDLKGSARSIPGVHIRDVLAAVATRHPGLISRFGGHAMAAGLGLPAVHFNDFARAFNEALAAIGAVGGDAGVIMSDGELPADALDLELAESIERLGPWGQGFPEPLFDGRFEVCSARIVGIKHFKLSLRAAPSAPSISAIYFNPPHSEPPVPGQRLHLAYRLTANDFQGAKKLELMIDHLDWLPSP